MKNKKKVHGTQEWAVKNVNCCTGCPHGCLYCYAKNMGVQYQWATEDTWTQCKVRAHDVRRRRRKPTKGRIMFPSSHDITPDNYDACRTVLANLLEIGNEVLIVSKPHYPVIQALCEEFKPFLPQMEFRFTIGATDNGILSVFEPFAPSFEERIESLAHAFHQGFCTSVSIEPMLDPEHINELVAELIPLASDTIWIGKLNDINRIPLSTPVVTNAVGRLKLAQSDDNILTIYQNLKDLPMIRWKDSIKKVVGLDLPEIAGMDV